MIRRQDGNVHLLSTSAMRGWESLPDGWQDAVAHANLIAIDDLHLADERIATELGMMIDYALNMGVKLLQHLELILMNGHSQIMGSYAFRYECLD